MFIVGTRENLNREELPDNTPSGKQCFIQKAFDTTLNSIKDTPYRGPLSM